MIDNKAIASFLGNLMGVDVKVVNSRHGYSSGQWPNPVLVSKGKVAIWVADADGNDVALCTRASGKLYIANEGIVAHAGWECNDNGFANMCGHAYANWAKAIAGARAEAKRKLASEATLASITQLVGGSHSHKICCGDGGAMTVYPDTSASVCLEISLNGMALADVELLKQLLGPFIVSKSQIAAEEDAP